MEKKYYFLKLNPRRADFAQTLTEEERTIMEQHAAYWRGFLKKGKVVVFGPVMDPKEVFGIGIVKADDEKELSSFIENDPAGRIIDYEFYPMRAVLREEE